MGAKMEPPSFDSTPEFAHFTEQMRKLIAVPKARVDELVKQAKESSPRNGNPHAPGRKRTKRSRSARI
jgi:hypothetical protein